MSLRTKRLSGQGIESLERREMLDSSAQLLGDVNPYGDAFGYYGAYPDVTEVGGKTFFRATNEFYQQHVWQTDGQRVWRVESAPQLDYGRPFVAAGDQLYFLTGEGLIDEGPDVKFELWRTDGTENGTARVFAGSDPQAWQWQLTSIGELLFFVAENDDHQRVLWISDGTTAGTRPVDTDSGTDPSDLMNVDGVLFFNIKRGGHTELWKSDGTNEGTELVSGAPLRPLMSRPVESQLFFTSDRGGRTELWKSGESGEGTEAVSLLPGRAYILATGESQIFLSVGENELWRSDGTAQGTSRLADIDAYTRMASAGDKLYFLAETETTGEELWVSDGTVEGTRLVKDIVPGRQGCGLARFLALDDTLFFSTASENGDGGLWKSDGTEQGTVKLKSGPVTPLQTGDGVIYFAGHDQASGIELWKSDGTVSGTVRITDVNVGPASSIYPRRASVAEANGTLYFTADDGTHGVELWSMPLPVDQEKSFTPEPGDANLDRVFDQLDLIVLLQAGKYSTRQPATFQEGDFDGDERFTQRDIVAALQTGNYLQAPHASMSRMSDTDVRFTDMVLEQEFFELVTLEHGGDVMHKIGR